MSERKEDLPKQVQYDKHEVPASPKYKYLQIPTMTYASGSTPALDGNSLFMQIKLPGSVAFNLSKSRLGYGISVGASVAAPGPIPNYNFLLDDCLAPFQRITLTDANGFNAVDMQHVARWTKLSDKIYTKKDDFLSRTTSDLSYPCNTDLTANIAPTSVFPANVYKANGGGSSAGWSKGFVNYVEPQYYVIASSAQAPIGVNKYIELGNLRGTLFEQDKDIYLGNNEVYLNLNTNPVDCFAFTSTSATSVTGAASTAGEVKLNNIILHLAVEVNSQLSDSVIAKFNSSGINFRTDCYLPTQTPLLAGPTEASITISIPNQKARLKRIISGIFPTSSNFGGLSDANNVNGTRIESFQNSMDEQPLTNQVIRCKWSSPTYYGNTDYRENAQYIKGSVYEGIPMYQLNWFNCDDWAGFDSIEYADERQNDTAGLDLHGVTRLYKMDMTTSGAALSLMTFAVISKDIHIGRDGLYFIVDTPPAAVRTA